MQGSQEKHLQLCIIVGQKGGRIQIQIKWWQEEIFITNILECIYGKNFLSVTMETPQWSNLQQLPAPFSVGVCLAIMFLLGCASPHPQPDEKKGWFIPSAGKIERNIMSALLIRGSSYQAEWLEHRGLKRPVHEKSNPFLTARPQWNAAIAQFKTHYLKMLQLCTLLTESMCNHSTDLRQDSSYGLHSDVSCRKFTIWNCSRFSPRKRLIPTCGLWHV